MKFEKLFSEFNIKNVTLKNRLVFLPHWTGFPSNKGIPSDEETYYYVDRAKGGVGLIVSGNYAVSEIGKMGKTFVDASDERCVREFKKTVKAVHKYGTKIFGQLAHAGTNKFDLPKRNCYAPSQVVEKSTSSYTIEIHQNEIKEVINSFRKSAENLVDGGFDGIEIKFAHDGILRIFMSPYYNKRVDKYGGTFENKIRIVSEVLLAIKETLKKDMVLGARLCLDEFEDEGYNLETGIAMAKYLSEMKLVDYINCDAGTWNTVIVQIPNMSFPLGCTEYMYASVKREINIPVIGFGRINDPVQAEQILANGSADLIGMARQLICDPETPNKSKRNKLDDIRKCIGCMEGCVMQCGLMQPIKCIQNPAVGKEKKFGINNLKKTTSTKKIVIVGGGVAGMKFAEIAAKRGNNIILFEKNNILGGQINLLKKIPFRNEFSEVIRYLEFQIKQLPNVTIYFSKVADEKSIINEDPDILIVASGSKPYIYKNSFNNKAVNSWEILNGTANIGKNIIIYDPLSANEGIGIVEYLFEIYQDIKVCYFTPLPIMGSNAYKENLDIILRKVMPLDLKVMPYHFFENWEKNKIIFRKIYTKEKFEVNQYDNFVFLGLWKSLDKLYWKFNGNIKEVYRLGDAKAPSCVEIAIHDAEELARTIS